MTCAEFFSRTRRTVPSVTLLVSLLLISPAHAQPDSEDKTEQKPPSHSPELSPGQQHQTETRPDGGKAAKDTDKSADKPAEAGSIERFDPSEEISKDLSVSFPVDI